MVLFSAAYLSYTQRMKYISVTAIYNNEAYLYYNTSRLIRVRNY